MQQVSPVYGYTIEKDGEFSKITYNKKKIGKMALFSFTVATFIPCIMITALITSRWNSLGGMVVVWLIFQVSFPCLILYLLNRQRTTGEIRIGSNSLVVDGKQYQFELIALVQMKNRQGAENKPAYVSGGGSYSPNLPGGINAMSDGLKTLSHSSGTVLSTALNASGYRITMRYAAKEIMIANHLGEHEVARSF